MRLIDAEVMLREIKKADEADPNLATCWSRGSIRRIIEGLPTIEAAPVVHGRWKYVEVIGFGYLSTCSECGHHDHETNYCPNCGARMDGDGGV